MVTLAVMLIVGIATNVTIAYREEKTVKSVSLCVLF